MKLNNPYSDINQHHICELVFELGLRLNWLSEDLIAMN